MGFVRPMLGPPTPLARVSGLSVLSLGLPTIRVGPQFCKLKLHRNAFDHPAKLLEYCNSREIMLDLNLYTKYEVINR